MDHHASSGFSDDAFFDLLAPTGDASKKGENQECSSYGGDDLLPSFSTDSLNSKARHRQPPAAGAPSLATSGACISSEPSELWTSTLKKERNMEAYHATVVTAVESTMKKYADNLLRVLEGMAGRLSQLELVTQGLEQSIREVRCTIADNHGEADGKLRALSNRLSEIHRTVQLLRDRQEIAEVSAEIEKLQLSKVELSGKGTKGSGAEGDAASLTERKPVELPPLPLLPAPPVSASPPQAQAQQPAMVQSDLNVNAKYQHAPLPLSPYNTGQHLKSYYTPTAHPQQSQPLEPQVLQPVLSSLQALPQQMQVQQPVPQNFQIEHPSLQHAKFQESSMPQGPQQPHTQQSMPQQPQSQQLMRQTAESQQLPPHHLHFPQSIPQQAHAQEPVLQQTQIQQPLPLPTQIQPMLHPQVQSSLPQQSQFQQPMPQHMQSLPQQEQVQAPMPQQPQLQPLSSLALHSQQLLSMQAQPVQHQMLPRSQALHQHLPSSQGQLQQVPGSPMFQPFPQPSPQGPYQYAHQIEARPFNAVSQAPAHSTPEYLLHDQFPYSTNPYLTSQQSGSLAPEQQKSSIHKHNFSLPLANSTYEPSGSVPPNGYGGSLYKVPQSGPGFQTANPRLPTAQPVGARFPPGFLRGAASPGIGGNNSINHTSIDEIIERVATMGFSRDQVRSVVQRLTENGQSADLNAVLDKLMNEGMDEHSQRNWYKR